MHQESTLSISAIGTQPLTLLGNLQLDFLRYGNTISMRGYAEKNGLRIGSDKAGSA